MFYLKKQVVKTVFQPKNVVEWFFHLFFPGHDSRFVIERNLGAVRVGNQESSWLYQQTLALHDEGMCMH